MLRRVHANSANLFHGRSPLSEICNDLILAQTMPSGPSTPSLLVRWPTARALAYNLGNFLRTLATPEPIKDWSLTSLKEKLIKIGAKVVSHGRYVAFQMAEVAIPKILFDDILRLIAELRPLRVTSTA
jgi:Transposase DDE domain group 1